MKLQFYLMISGYILYMIHLHSPYIFSNLFRWNRHPLFCPPFIWFVLLKPGTALKYLDLPTPPLHVLADFKMPQFPFCKSLCHMGQPSSSGIHKPLFIINHYKGKKAQFPQSINPKQIFLYATPVICQHIYPTMPL